MLQQIKTEKNEHCINRFSREHRETTYNSFGKKGHSVTVISSNPERKTGIEVLGAKAAIGSMYDAGFLTATFKGADIVYLMETMEAAGDMFDKSVDFIEIINKIGENYKTAVKQSGVKKVTHLSSIGTHTDEGIGILIFHYNVESILRQLPDDVAIKFIRPVGFYINMFLTKALCFLFLLIKFSE